MKQFFIQVPGTIVPYFSDQFAPYAPSIHPDLFTGQNDLNLIPLGELQKTHPKIGVAFEPLYQDIPSVNRFYFQWKGDIFAPMKATTPWDDAGEFLAKKIVELAGDSKEEVEIRALTHSHGLQPLRIAAEILRKTHPHIKFKVISVSNPKCINPPIVMPGNTTMWQDFFYGEQGRMDFGDKMAYLASWQMQGICSKTPVKRKIEDVLKEMGHSERPSLVGKQWDSYDLRPNLKKPLDSPHEDSMRGEAAKFICDTVVPKLQQEERPAKRRRLNQ